MGLFRLDCGVFIKKRGDNRKSTCVYIFASLFFQMTLDVEAAAGGLGQKACRLAIAANWVP